tara:strand:+ start:761 stop:1171 length:411 start_codon:yes stop_codon:yes gene_type:complete
MAEQQHIVTLIVTESEILDLFSWVSELKGVKLVSTERMANDPMDTKAVTIQPEHNDSTYVDDQEHDHRLVKTPEGRVVIDASLKALGLSEEYLRNKMPTKFGTTEHKVKMAIVRRDTLRKKQAREGRYTSNGILAA